MDYLSLGKDSIRLVSSKRKGRAADPVYASVLLRLDALKKLEHRTSKRIGRWYRNVVNMRVWLPKLQKKAQDRKKKRAVTRIQRVTRGILARNHVNGVQGIRVRYNAAAVILQSVGRSFILKAKERNQLRLKHEL